ncbi:allophanate hydrolase [Bradyrhizobium sp. dw_78]|uniref:allophanate hydrolase n=1 Tax=Bradyrhizobium sp. dw_78 TaxID=2719793 RepID=UPI001BD6D9FA|nr:allophanate hydrolase [Bradyrhizobium sp. dw_78]
MKNEIDLSLETLRKTYASGAGIRDIISRATTRIAEASNTNAWIHVESRTRLMERCDAIELRRSRGEAFPLYGIPFGVKDNIDVAGMPTTAACPGFKYTPDQSAHAVQLLLDAGGICMGKTNLDQFATGLSGARSAYGTCASVANPLYVSGGSSSGSAVAVAAKHVSFALGTDTGGSGRIPAGFNGIVGIKPSIGRVSTRGLVPNCRSLDCVSIFSDSVSEGMEILRIIDGFDIDDPYCRNAPARTTDVRPVDGQRFTFGRLGKCDLKFFGMDEGLSIYEEACDSLADIGGEPVEIDFAPFAEAGQLLFSGPWIAERRSALGPFASKHPDALLDVIHQVLKVADNFSAAQVFDSMNRLASLKRGAEKLFSSISAMVVPTAARAYTIEQMEENPIEFNNRLGHYSYFANLLELCAIAVPSGILSCGVPMGVTLLAPAWSDERLGSLASRFEAEVRKSDAHPQGRARRRRSAAI